VLALQESRSRRSQPSTTTGTETACFAVTTEVNADVSLWQKATRPLGERASLDLLKGCDDSASTTPRLDAPCLLTSCTLGTASASLGDDDGMWSLQDGTITGSQFVMAGRVPAEEDAEVNG